MKIGIYNLEPSYHNYALDKIRVYYQDKGDIVEDYFALAHHTYDKIYCSSIFSWTPKIIPPDILCGGSGFNLTGCLPPEINAVKPHLNYGFMTRGCPNNCPFCIVPRKEGKPYIEDDLLDLWDGKSKIVVAYDNNLLAIPVHFWLVTGQAIENHITLDINQGLDHRKLTPEICVRLHITPHVEYHFAFDNPVYKPTVERAITMLSDAGINRSTWYVLVGYNTTFQEDLDRLNYLRERNQNAYVQRYNMQTTKQLTSLARWANQHHIFHGMTWEQFTQKENNL